MHRNVHSFSFSPILLCTQVKPVQGVSSVGEEMGCNMSHNPIDKTTEEKNPTSANTAPKSSVWNINWIHTTEFTPVSKRQCTNQSVVTLWVYSFSVIFSLLHIFIEITVNCIFYSESFTSKLASKIMCTQTDNNNNFCFTLEQKLQIMPREFNICFILRGKETDK